MPAQSSCCPIPALGCRLANEKSHSGALIPVSRSGGEEPGGITGDPGPTCGRKQGGRAGRCTTGRPSLALLGHGAGEGQKKSTLKIPH